MVAAFREWVDIESDSDEVVEHMKEAVLAIVHLHTKMKHTVKIKSKKMVLKCISNFEECELEFDVAFTLHKQLSCFSHTLQLVVWKIDSVQSLKVVKKVNKSVKATKKLIAFSG